MKKIVFISLLLLATKTYGSFNMDYIDPDYGDDYPNSYWKVVQVNLSDLDKSGQIVFYGYVDSTPPKGKKPTQRQIGQHSYSFSGAKYDQYFSPNLGKKDRTKQAEQLAIDTLDVDTGEKDQQNQEIFVSFFDEAIQN